MAQIETKLTGIILRQTIREDEIVRLIKEHVVGPRTIQKYHQLISQKGDNPTVFPAIFVHPNTWKPTKTAVGKYDYWGEVTIWLYSASNDVQRAGDELEKMVAILDKLFSDNALNDLETSAATGQYYVHDGFWIESEFGPVKYSPAWPFQKDNETVWVLAGSTPFRYRDILLP